MVEPVNPADLVPFVDNPDPKPSKAQLDENLKAAQAEAGFPQNEEPDYKSMFDGFTQLRGLVDSIPTKGQDEGDALGSFSLFAVTKDVLSGTLGLMEAPRRGVIPEQVFEDTLKMGAGAAGINVARGGAAGASAGMFGARPSASAGRRIHEEFNAKIKRAQEIEEKGKDLEWRAERNVANDEELQRDIWEITGLSKDHRGDWRYSIMEDIENPGQARINWENYDRDIIDPYTPVDELKPLKLGDVLIAPKAYEHWPELKDVNFRMNYKHGGTGSYNPINNEIVVNPIRLMERGMDDPNATLRVLVHEAQHALQNMQDRPQGAGVSWIAKAMDDRIEWFKRWKTATKENYRTNTELAAINKFDNVVAAWDRMQKTFSREMAAYWASPGEVEARLAEAMAANPRLAKRHPEDFESTNAANAPARENRFEPEDIDIPTQTQATPHGPTDGKKPFGKRGPESHPMDDPDFEKLPPEVRDIITNEVPSVLNKSGSKVGDFPDNRNVHPQYYPMIVESLNRRAKNFKKQAMEILERGGTDEWSEAIAYRKIAQESEEQAHFYQGLIKEGATRR